MTPRNRSPRPGEAGFVLIGVVIFVLALTIIGISLFSLSSYEAQFFQRSLEGEQAFQSAVGGIERAKFALARDSLLSSVKDDLPLENVTAATAIQMQGGLPDSTGPVQWEGEDVTLRVTARVNQERRTVEGWFRPHLTREVYSQLIATSGGIGVMPFAPDGSDRRFTIYLTGPIWQGTMPPDPSDWLSVLHHPLPTDISTDPLALPAVAQYLSSHSGSPSGDPEGIGLWWRYRLGAGGVDFFSTPSSMTGDPDFSLDDSQHLCVKLEVTGCAIWLMSRGIRFDQKVTVVGTSGPGSDCLIIVAGRSVTFPDDPDAGILFLGGLESGIPVILISDGSVYIQDMTDPSGGPSSSVQDLTVYARDVVLTGPRLGAELSLTHVPGGSLDTYWVPLLADGGYLPNVTSTSGRELTLRPGTWHASDR